MSGSKLRRLTIADALFLWRMEWFYDLDGERIVRFTALFSEPGRTPPRPRGQPLRARFVSSGPSYPVDTAAVLPGDARAAIDAGRALGWNGERELWLLPSSGFTCPQLRLSSRTRLREWAGDAQLYTLFIEGAGLAEPLAQELGLLAVAETAGADEEQWRDARWFLVRWRPGTFLSLYCRTAPDLTAALLAMARLAPTAGLSVSVKGAQVIGPVTGELPRSAVPPLTSWAAQPGAVRYPGPRPGDATWLIPDPDGLHLEVYQHHADAPDRLWRWLTVRGESATERRFRR